MSTATPTTADSRETPSPQGRDGESAQAPALRGAQRAPLPQAIKEAALVRLHRGESATTIARELGLKKTTVEAWKRKAGLQRQIRGGLPEEVRRAAVERVRAGESAKHVAASVGVHLMTVLEWCRQRDVRPRGANYPPEVKAEALRLVDDLGTATAAAGALGIPAATVVEWCEKAHKPLQQSTLNTRRVRSLESKIVKLLDTHSGAAVARQLEVSWEAVAAIAARHGKAFRGVQPAPITVRDPDELAERAAEIRALAAHAPRVTRAKESHRAAYLDWCERQNVVAASDEGFAAFLLDKLRHGVSGRPADRGQHTGCTAGTIGQWRADIADALAAMGHPGASDWPLVRRAMQRVRREAPVGGKGRRRLAPAEIETLAQVPPPRPSDDVLLTRVAAALWACAPLSLAAAVHSATLGPQPLTGDDTTGACADETPGRGADAIGFLAGTRARPRLVVLGHRPGLAIGCGHCAADELTRRTAWPGTGHTLEVDRTRLRKRLQRACRDGRIDPAARATEADADRLAWLVDRDLVRWVRTQAYAALLRTVGGRAAEILTLMLGDLRVSDDSGWQLRTRRRKNDQFGRGQVTGLAAAQLPGTMARLELWLFLLGPDLPDDAPLFPGRTGGPLHRSSGGAALSSLFEAAGVEGRVGAHSFRRTLISELLERGVFLSRVAARIGITAQTAYGYYEAMRVPEDTAAQLGLAP